MHVAVCVSETFLFLMFYLHFLRFYLSEPIYLLSEPIY